MRKRLFSVLAALLVFGCGGDMDNLPCLTCDENAYSYCLYNYGGGSYSCQYVSNCNGANYGDDYTCGNGGFYQPSSSSSYRSSSSSGLSACSEGTVRIGSQVWQKCNSNAVPGTGNSWCYDNKESNCTIYGRLYWAAAMALPSDCNNNYCSGQIDTPHRGICPSGWHIPSDADWDALMTAVGGSSTYAKYLKATDGWYDCGPSGSGNSFLCEDKFEFSALPGGDYGYYSGFDGAGYCGTWWSSSEDTAINGAYSHSRGMSCGSEEAIWYGSDKSFFGHSVRCVMDCSDCGGGSSSSVARSSSSSVAQSSSSSVASSSSAATYTVTYNANNGSGAPAAQVKTQGVALTLSSTVPTRAGYTFAGWNTAAGGGGTSYAAGGSYTGNANLTLYAQWMAVSSSSSSSVPVASNCSLNGGTVNIGGQVWMAENLNCNVSGSVCYNNDPANCDKYGRLYDWSTAMALSSSCNSMYPCSSQIGAKHRGICPSGWHIPTMAEWDALTTYIESNKNCTSCDAKHLKSTSGWYDNGNGLDTYGFAALPGGYGNSGGGFYDAGDGGLWWSASEGNGNGAYGRYMNYSYEYAYGYNNFKSSLLSVRCLQD